MNTNIYNSDFFLVAPISIMVFEKRKLVEFSKGGDFQWLEKDIEIYYDIKGQ